MGFLRLFSRQKPKIKQDTVKKEGFSGWIKCSGCEELIHVSELEDNLCCCPKCEYHYKLSVQQRLDLLLDSGSFRERDVHLLPSDPLEFKDAQPYKKRLADAQKKSSQNEAVRTGEGRIHNHPVAIAVLDFSFMGGSMGSVVGEKLTRIIEYALKERLPLIIVSASGGARMQESIFSLMQMAKTSAALARLGKEGIPYISVLTNPTMGGVTASFASLGDIILAEPDALIGFAGPRVVEQTIRQKLPKTAQKSEFLLEKGMIDRVVKRSEMKETLHFFIEFLTANLEEKKTPQETLDELISISARNRRKNTVEVNPVKNDIQPS